MPDKQSNNRRPTPLEDEAHRTMMREFSGEMKQFAVAQVAVANFEKIAPRVVREVAGGVDRNQSLNLVLADDGNQWNVGRELMDKVHLCHRSTASGAEFAVVECLDVKSQVSYDVLAKGRKPEEVLRNFADGQRDVLRVWADDFSAQVKEQLVLKYPGHDLSRVVEAINHRCTEAGPHRQTIKSGETQKRTGEVKI